MKKTVLLSMAVAAVLFTACGEETKKAAGETAAAAKETIKTAAAETKVAAKEAITIAKEKTAEAVETAKESAAPVMEAATQKVENASEKIKDTIASESKAVQSVNTQLGKDLYVKCVSCHGTDGKTKAMGKSEIIAGQSAAVLESKITEYRAGTRNVTGIGMIMNAQVARLGDKDIKALASYISGL